LDSIRVGHILAALSALVAGTIGGGGNRRGAPDAPSPQLTFAAVSAGSDHTCGVTAAGVAYCWGTNYVLGDGFTLPAMDPATFFRYQPRQPTPVLVAGDLTFAALSAGSSVTCGVTTARTAYCWGSNGEGQLGDGAPHDFERWGHVPVLVAGGLDLVAVSPGVDHTCGVTRDGAAYCWGRDGFGMLGDGGPVSGPYRTSPAIVVGELKFTAVSAGDYHTCGITGAGVAYCWGLNDKGQLGDGTVLAQHEGRSSPVPVAAGVTFAAVSAGRSHTCGITAAGAAYCWGSNWAGQLGDGTTTDRPSPIPVVGGLSVGAVSAGGSHTCALTATGAAYCWGNNNRQPSPLSGNLSGQLGDGTKTSRSSPVPVGGDLSFVGISAGGDHTCGVTAAGVAYCWGANYHGQLGDGSSKSRSRPVRVAQ